jgi:ankyrin repeat protein
MWPAIHTLCIRSSDVTEIENQLPKDGVSSHSTFGSSPLHFACLSNSFQIVKYLVSNGADVNARNENGETPLHFAAKQSSKEIVQYLVDHGADPMLIDKGK